MEWRYGRNKTVSPRNELDFCRMDGALENLTIAWNTYGLYTFAVSYSSAQSFFSSAQSLHSMPSACAPSPDQVEYLVDRSRLWRYNFRRIEHFSRLNGAQGWIARSFFVTVCYFEQIRSTDAGQDCVTQKEGIQRI